MNRDAVIALAAILGTTAILGAFWEWMLWR